TAQRSAYCYASLSIVHLHLFFSLSGPRLDRPNLFLQEPKGRHLPAPPTSISNVEKRLMRRQRMRTEHQPGLLTLEHPVYERLDGRLHGRQLLGESLHREVLHAEYLIDRQPGEHLLVIDHQHAP